MQGLCLANPIGSLNMMVYGPGGYNPAQHHLLGGLVPAHSLYLAVFKSDGKIHS